jgi:uncharacterized protein (TIGR00369 family)
MEETNVSTREWLEEELNFRNVRKTQTLDGRLGAKLEDCNDARQELTLRFPVQEWQVNELGRLHGGMINTMVDMAMSLVIYCFSRQSIPPTVSMTTNYLRPVPMEGSVLVRAHVTSIGKRYATAYCEVLLPANSKVACTAIGTYAMIHASPGK